VTGKDAYSPTVTATRDGDQRLGIPSAGSVLTGSDPDLIRVTDLVADAQRRGSDADPGSAFFGFLARLADEGAAKRDTSDAITVPGALRSDIHDALAVVLARSGRRRGAYRHHRRGSPHRVRKGLLVAVNENPDHGRVERVLAVLTDGLRPPSA
jgi:hypothetical protein